MDGGICGVGIAINIIAAGGGTAGIADEGAIIRTVIRGNEGAVATTITAHPTGLCGKRRDDDCGSDDEFCNDFHIRDEFKVNF